MNSVIKILNLSAILILLIVNTSQAVDLTFRGTLRDAVCTLHPASEQIDVQFLTISNKTFGQGRPTQGIIRKFSIKLEDCNLQYGNWVQVSFTGASAGTGLLSGKLQINSTEPVLRRHLGIGLVHYALGGPRDVPIRSNATPVAELLSGNETHTLNFGAYLQASNSVANGSVVLRPGSYDATLYFKIFYP